MLGSSFADLNVHVGKFGFLFSERKLTSKYLLLLKALKLYFLAADQVYFYESNSRK